MVKRPDAIPGAGQNVTTQNVEAETKNDIEIVGAELVDCLGREAMHEPFRDGNNIEPRTSSEEVGAVHRLERIEMRVQALVESAKSVVEKHAAAGAIFEQVSVTR
ncbi:MAG: hypothetical protein JOY83_07795 [Alphaproteobacteria bacterium]|nr:hypothetical protein [Alphaproteobacteria bacterium]